MTDQSEPTMHTDQVDISPSIDPLLRFLEATAQDLTALARQSRLHEAYGRDAEVAAVLRILAHPQTARPLVVGPPKVGKTALIHEVVRRMALGNCPASLHDVTVYELAPGPLVADLGGNWRDQLPGFLRDLADHNRVILYFRDLALAAVPGVKSHEAAVTWVQALVEQLHGASLRCIVEVRTGTLRRLEAGVPDLDEVFTRVVVDEPPPPAVATMVDQVAADLEVEHAIPITAAARAAAISLTRRFRVGQAFPGKAIALIEGAAARLADPDVAPSAVLDAPAVAALFAEQTGLSRALTDDSLPFEEAAVRRHLAERVIGQDAAIEAIVQTVSLIKARLNDPRRPLGAFLFLGPTGVGKTELSKALAAWLFGDANRLVRFNMADYTDFWDFEKLFGDEDEDEDPAKRRGQLTIRLADEPFAVLLLDEFEKAHPNIFQRFLQLFDEGVLINADSETVNLRNTIIIVTSNFGARAYATDDTGIGFVRPDYSDSEIEAHIETALEQQFTPEFVNRLDRVCFFRALGKLEVLQIARREIEQLFQREGVAERGLVIEMDDTVVEQVVERGYSPKFGARHLKRQIERTIAYPLAQAILGQSTRPGDLVRLFVRGGRVRAALVPEEAERGDRPDRPDRPRDMATAEGPAAPADDGGATRRFALADLRAALPEIEARVTRVEVFHQIETARARAADLMAAMSDPAFWDDAKQAEAELATLGELTHTLERCEGLRRAVDDMAAALALVDERGAKTMVGEAARQYRYLLRELPRAEIGLLLTGPWDRGDAFVLLTAPAGDVDAGTWPEDLFGAYRSWARRRGFEVAVIDETRDPGGRLLTAALALRGHGAYGLLKGESGAHRWLQPRADGGREAIHVRVTVVPDLARNTVDALDPAAVEVTARAVNARGQYLGRLRSHATAVHLPTGTAVALTNDHSVDENRGLCTHVLAALLTARARRAQAPLLPDAEALWGAVVRTYCVYKGHYVRDMRTGVTETHVRRVLDGHLDAFLEAYLRAGADSGT